MSLIPSKICLELDPSRFRRGAVRKSQAGFHVAALTMFVLGFTLLPFAAMAQPQAVGTQVAGLPLRPRRFAGRIYLPRRLAWHSKWWNGS